MRKSSLFAKSILPGIVLCLSLTTVSAFALNHFRIVNKDPTPLSFTIEKNGANAPELPSNFILLSKQSIKTVIPNSNQEVYIGVKPINTPTGVVAFFGINKYGKQLILSGYGTRNRI